MKSHKDLEVWKNSINLVTEIYRLTSSFPKDEIYSLVSQIRRSSVSISSNIAEGAARKSKKEFIQFLYIVRGSLSELETQLIISQNLNYIIKEDHIKLELQQKLIGKQLSSLIKYLTSTT